MYVLCLLARVYGTDVLCLLDLADHESLPQQDRLVLMGRQRAEAPVREQGMTLTLPYVPVRLVIEVSSPAVDFDLLGGGSHDLEAAPAQLALLRDSNSWTASDAGG
jgi:hypothetical protein